MKLTELVIATSNMHKIRELRSILKHLRHLDILSLSDFPHYTAPPETGSTFQENALLKARHAATALGRWVLADDSGLVVPALGGEPGVRSARYAGENATDADNRKKLLEQMHHLMAEDRRAYFECCLALVSPSGKEKCVCASCEGAILSQPTGGGGFGYDSLFIKDGYSKTFGELEESTKNRISHRR
ncbi:MAG: nucleoside-triphosphatase, partial [Chlamydiota bacterium]